MRLGVVVIGRNEANALERCLQTALRYVPAVVYADSASTDDSVAIAERMGIAVVRLTGKPMSAARGRNAGRALLRERFPALEYIQFVDGDCELEPGWIERAAAFLDAEPDVGVVAGRLRERFRERNAYHRLADMEFDTPTGDVDAVGGIAMFRTSAFDRVGGFDPHVVSGEERELCRRILEGGQRIVRLPATMAHHDIHMDELRQWWKRTKRAGYTSAEHLADRGIMGRNVLSIMAWGAAVPVLSLTMALPTFGGSLWLLCAYAVLWQRVRKDRLRRGAEPRDAALYASATVFGKLPEAAGVFEFGRKRLFDRSRQVTPHSVG
jgi:glycosyltransferase involved in cell wall biosynthesis